MVDENRCVALMILAGRNAWPRSCPTCGIGVCPYYPRAHAHLKGMVRERLEQLPAEADPAAVASRIEQGKQWDEVLGGD